MKIRTLHLLLLVAPTISGFGVELMSERFNGSGYTISASLNGLAGGNGFGGPWQVQTGVGSTLTISAGLTFTDYPVSGNALTLNVPGTGFGNLAGAGRDIGDASIPSTGGDLWMSYLYRRNSGGSGGDDSRISIRDSGLTNDRFILTSRDDLLEQNGGVGIDASDQGGTNDIQTAGAVFLLIAKFTNFGNGSPGNPQTGRFWALRPQDYDAIKSGGITESELIASAWSTGADTPVTTPIGFTTADVILLNSTIGAASSGYNYTVDELRWATDLASVIPEPSTSVLALLGAVMLGVRRRAAGLR